MAGRYRTIVADPPWEIGEFPAGEAARARGETASYATPYRTMTLDQIKALPVNHFADQLQKIVRRVTEVA